MPAVLLLLSKLCVMPVLKLYLPCQSHPSMLRVLRAKQHSNHCHAQHSTLRAKGDVQHLLLSYHYR